MSYHRYRRTGISLTFSLLLGVWGIACVPTRKPPLADPAPPFPSSATHLFARDLSLTTVPPSSPLTVPRTVLPSYFEANRGQETAEVQYLARGHGYTVFLTPTRTVVALRQGGPGSATSKYRTPGARALANRQTTPHSGQPTVAIQLQLVGAATPLRIKAEDPLAGTVNYFRGQDPSQWRTGIPTYAKVRAHSVYPGIDLVYYGHQRQLEYDFQVQAGADPSQIRMRFVGVEDVKLDARGDAILYVSGGEIRLSRPQVFQEIDGQRHTVASAYQLIPAADENATADVGIRLSAYDTGKPLVIDPVLSASTYLGGESEDFAECMALDSNGEVIVAGWTESPNFPVVQALQSHVQGNANPDVFVVKQSAQNGAIVYATYLGGDGRDAAHAMAVDRDGFVYIAGETNSANFPVAHALQPTYKGSDALDTFVAKLAPNGSALSYATYLGGRGNDVAEGIAVDNRGDAIVVGWTESPDFPVTTALQATNAGQFDAFIVKIPSTGAALVYATFLGGSEVDGAEGVAVDRNGDVVVVGWTSSPNFPVVNAVQPIYGGNANLDAFVVKLTASGNALVYATYLGGSGTDGAHKVTLDGSHNAVVAGWTESADFPVFKALQSTQHGGVDVFVAKLTANGNALQYATYLGGSADDYAGGIAMTRSGQAVVVGATDSQDFPLAHATQAAYGGGFDDAFVAQLTTDGGALEYATYLGGDQNDLATGIALDRGGHAIMVGNTDSANFPAVHNPRPFQGALDAFVATLGNEVSAQGKNCDIVWRRP